MWLTRIVDFHFRFESHYSSPPITTFDHTQISLLPVPKFQPASGKPRPRAGVLKFSSLSKLLPKNVSVVTLLQQPCLPNANADCGTILHPFVSLKVLSTT